MKRRVRFDRPGLLAIHPQSWGLEFDAYGAEPAAPFRTVDDVAVVDVMGPLQHHAGWWCDSYDAITARFAAALASPCKAVVLNLDSPGGETAGAFEAARDLRAMADAAGKPVIAFADGMMASAAYALACAADKIYAQPTAIVGSIGVVAMMVDETARDAMFGVKVAVVASGARKADGNPHQPLTDDARAAVQRQVDALAGVFFALVSERRGLATAAVRALEANVFSAADAVGVGLVDAVMTWTEVLAAISAGGSGTTAQAAATKGKPMEKYEELLAALKKMAEGEGEDADAAKKALAALEKGDEPHEEPDGDEGKGGEGDGDGDERTKAAAGAVDVVALAKTVHELKAAAAKKERDEEREKLLASRPDFDEAVLSVLRKAPMATVREAVKTWKRGPVVAKPAPSPAAAAQPGVAPTRGATQSDETDSKLPAADKLELDRAMGLAPAASAIRLERNAQILPALTPAEAKRLRAAKENAR